MGAEINRSLVIERDHIEAGNTVMRELCKNESTLAPGSGIWCAALPNRSGNEAPYIKMVVEQNGTDEIGRDKKYIAAPAHLQAHAKQHLASDIQNQNHVTRSVVLSYASQLIGELMRSLLDPNVDLECYTPENAKSLGSWYPDFVRGKYSRKNHDFKEMEKIWNTTFANHNLPTWNILKGLEQITDGLTIKLVKEQEVRKLPAACFGIE